MTKRASTWWITGISIVFALVSFAFAAESPGGKDAPAAPVVRTTSADTMRIEGEQRFHANCGRCHAAPQKFPPRMMATVLRHMRVRATITDEDRKLILFYMTQ
jgi:hypothetical protein